MVIDLSSPKPLILRIRPRTKTVKGKKMEEANQALSGFDKARNMRDLLENFETVGLGQYFALIPSYEYDLRIRENVEAALMASMLRLSSIDYTKKKYCSEKVIDNSQAISPAKKYTQAYLTSKGYVKLMQSKASSEIASTERLGSFGAAIALTRLQYSFFSAHLLYQLGHQYEAHAVSRLILEQIAWAYSASQLTNLDDIKQLVTTKCIGKLKELNRDYGRLYGILSTKVHIDYGNHREFLRVENGQNIILLNHADYAEYAFIMLTLADLFGIVWELSQESYIQNFEATRIVDGVRTIREDRPFRKIANEYLTAFQEIEKENRGASV